MNLRKNYYLLTEFDPMYALLRSLRPIWYNWSCNTTLVYHKDRLLGHHNDLVRS